MAKGIGLVGNLAYWGVSGLFIGYCCWEMTVLKENMPEIDEDHPINEIFEQKKRVENITGRTLKDGENIFDPKYSDLKFTTIYHKSENYQDEEEADM